MIVLAGTRNLIQLNQVIWQMTGFESSILHEGQLDKWEAFNGKKNSMGTNTLLFSMGTTTVAPTGSLLWFLYTNGQQYIYRVNCKECVLIIDPTEHFNVVG